MNNITEKEYRAMFNMVYRLVRYIHCIVNDAEDLTQEILIKAAKNWTKFDPEKASFNTWLSIITKNTIVDYHRKKKIITSSINELTDYEDSYSNMISNLFVSKELTDDNINASDRHKILYKAIEKISPIYSEILKEYYFNELSLKEIAYNQSKPIGTVKAQINRAIKQLGDVLNKQNFNLIYKDA